MQPNLVFFFGGVERCGFESIGGEDGARICLVGFEVGRERWVAFWAEGLNFAYFRVVGY